jgi:hypothetical protein
MDNLLWEICLLIAGALLGVIASRLWERWRTVTEKNAIWVDVDMRTIQSLAPVPTADLEIRVDGLVVRDPWEVKLYIWSAGENDIRTESFQGAPQTVSLGAGVVSQSVTAEHQADGVVTTISPSGGLTIQPGYVPKRFAREYRLITEGRPKIEWENTIADCEVRSFWTDYWKPSAGRSAMKWIGRALIGVAILGFGLIGVLAGLETNGEMVLANVPGLPFVITLGASVSFTGGIILSTFSDLASRRAIRALRVLRRSLGQRVMDWARSS